MKNRLVFTFRKYIAKRMILPKSECQIFLQRNKVFVAISIICLFLYIKQSDAPFPGDYNVVTSFLFEKPSQTSISGAIFSFVCELGLAFITGFFFYLVVDYFPQRKRERIAFHLISEKVEVIDVLLGKLFSFLMFISGVGTNFMELHPSQASNLCGIALSNDVVHCHSRVLHIETQQIIEEGNPDCINYFFGPKEFATKILSQAEVVFNLPYSANIEDNFLQLMTQLRNNCMLENLSYMPEDFIQMKSAKSYICNYSVKDVIELYFLFLRIRCYPYSKYLVTIEAASPENVQAAQDTWNTMQQQFPESFRMMAEFQNRNSNNK